MMKSLLVHGCYDQQTFQTLNSLGVRQFGFDLRPRSSQLIRMEDLKLILNGLITEEVVLIFENDLPATIFSVLDLLKEFPHKFILEFRDALGSEIYRQIDHDFYWVFQPDVDWKSILSLPRAKGVLLPTGLQEHYQRSELWRFFDEKNLRIILQTKGLEEASVLALTPGVELGVDLDAEWESEYRKVDQERLRKNKLWSYLNEGSAL